MGVLRGGFVVILSVVFFLAIFLSNAFLNLTWALEFQTLQPNLENYANGMVNETGIRDQLVDNIQGIEYYCMTHTNYVFVQNQFSLEIPCTVVDGGVDKIISYGIDQLIENIYYEEYDCEFWNCIKESDQPLVLISEKAKNYWFDKFKLALWISIIAFALLFIFSRDKGWAVMWSGIMVMLSAFIFKKFGWVFSKLLPNISILDILKVFLSKSQNVFIIMMVVGGFLFVMGVILKFFKVGFSFSKIFKKKEIKEPLSKEELESAVKNAMNEKKISKKKSKKKDDYVDLGKK